MGIFDDIRKKKDEEEDEDETPTFKAAEARKREVTLFDEISRPAEEEVEEAKKLAESIGVELMPELFVRHGPPPGRSWGPPAERFELVLEAIVDLLKRANASVEPEPKKKKKAPLPKVEKQQ